ncbi:MAG: 1-acyl-sn-glycerol-3-phosphate acyltransferase [Candidatus Hydrogenedentes bacterium]|nr:1-acyl-sn-glycerol-3-phosphate acyltransferase [Candidatus Hydrogenedentota bacterium]
MGLAVWMRVAWRATALVVWTTSLFAIRLLVKTATPLSPAFDEWGRRLLLRIWASGAAAIIRMRFRISGAAPKPPYFLVTNHLSYLDIVMLSRTSGCVFVSRADVRQLPFLGFLAAMMNTIFINRESMRDTKRVNEQIAFAMDRGYGVHIFAESRISQDAQVHPFKPPLLEPAVQRGCPVHYAAISYRTPESAPRAHDVIVWRDDETLPQNMLRVLALPASEGIIAYGDAPIAGTERKALANALYHAVQDRFTPVG